MSAFVAAVVPGVTHNVIHGVVVRRRRALVGQAVARAGPAVTGQALLPSGGLRYHARALVHRRRWAPFVARLGRWWQTDWAPAPGRPLLLVGCSAGWCLPLDVVARGGFAAVVAVDLDPLALALLRRRLRVVAPTLPVRTIVGDGLGVQDAPTGQALQQLLAAHPTAHVLFCNVWGQQIFEVDDDDARARWRAALPDLLRGRSWASFFDRVSGPVAPRIDDGNERSDASLPDAALLERFYARARTSRTRIELVDHGTEDVVVDRPRLHLHWALRPGHHHLIEAVTGRAP